MLKKTQTIILWSLITILGSIVFAHESQLAMVAKETFAGCFSAIEDQAYFLKEFFTKYKMVGAIAPSSYKLAQAITQAVDNDTNEVDRTILEVGAGTGVFTEVLLNRLRNNDVLVAIEYVPSFVKMLEKKFKT